MSIAAPNLRPFELSPVVETFLLGELDFDTCLALQQRLVYEAGGGHEPQITVLLCEHRPIVTLGRLGSRAHVRVPPEQLTSRKLEVRWTNRGGGCLLHLPGQLAIYPIVPLAALGWTVGEYARRLNSGLTAALTELGVPCQTPTGRFGIWGRTGQLVVVGAAVRNWVTYHGAFLNVDPEMRTFRGFQTDPDDDTMMSSLAVERQQKIKMATVRAVLTEHLAKAFGGERTHLYSSHPLLARLRKNRFS
jgi:lipoyl(octanoyl) transferase